ncbi:MAG: efflux RND transporter periplasmic adaptor subunit [Acidobacteriota bacterium]
MLSSSLSSREHLRRRQALAGSILLLLVLLAPLFVFRLRSQPLPFSLAAASEDANANVPTVIVQHGALKKTLLLDGELRAVRSRTIYANTNDDAKIVYLPPEGTVIKAGERIAELDSSSVLTKIKDTEERIIAAENEIVRTKAQHEAALRDLEVELSKLWLAHEQAKLKAKVPAEVLARREYQEGQLTLEKTRTEYDNQLNKIEQKKKEQAAELQVKTIEKEKMKVQLDRATSNLDGMRIKAPADGMVIYTEHWNERRKIQTGDVIWGGFPIVRLPDLTEMEVLAQVNEVDGPKLSIGSKAEIRLDSYPDTVITGEVKEISQTAIKASWMAKAKIFRVTISLDKTVTEIMKPGMSALVSVIVQETPAQLRLPRAAVKFDGDQAKVTRLEADHARREIAVTILASNGEHYLVADNGALKANDKILAQ